MQIKIISTAHPLYPKVLELRNQVLRQPLGRSIKDDDLSDEVNQVIFAGIEASEVIACALLKAVAPGIMKLRQMAVENEYQGKGLGNQVLQAAEVYSLQNGAHRIELHARKYALPFYEKSGYHVQGPEFKEVGIPHFMMSKQLDQ